MIPLILEFLEHMDSHVENGLQKIRNITTELQSYRACNYRAKELQSYRDGSNM